MNDKFKDIKLDIYKFYVVVYFILGLVLLFCCWLLYKFLNFVFFFVILVFRVVVGVFFLLRWLVVMGLVFCVLSGKIMCILFFL